MLCHAWNIAGLMNMWWMNDIALIRFWTWMPTSILHCKPELRIPSTYIFNFESIVPLHCKAFTCTGSNVHIKGNNTYFYGEKDVQKDIYIYKYIYMWVWNTAISSLLNFSNKVPHVKDCFSYLFSATRNCSKNHFDFVILFLSISNR